MIINEEFQNCRNQNRYKYLPMINDDDESTDDDVG